MKHSHLAFISGFLLFVILAISWCGKKSQTEVTGSPTPAQTSSPSSAALSPSPSASTPVAQPSTQPSSKTSSPEFQKVASKVGPAVILVTVFDRSGRLLRTGTGFFISEDGRFVTNSHIVEGGANAVAKSADGKIRNVTGVLTSSDELDLAVLKAETKTGVPFLPLKKGSERQTDTSVAVIGSSLVRREQPLATATISARRSDQRGDRLETSNPISNDAEGSPVVDASGEVLGIVTPTRAQGTIEAVVRPASTLESLLAQIKPDTKARWAAASSGSLSPQPNPSPQPSARAAGENRKSKLTYNPAPRYPPDARLSRVSGSGRFRIIFSADGAARDVRVIESTGKPVLDQAAADSLRQWKSEPGHEWSVVVPITFKP